MLEREMAVREKEVEAIQAQAKALAQEDQSAGEVERTSRAVEEKFRALCQPMKERCRRLQASREQHQFHRDVEDEIVSHQAGHGMASYPQPRGSLVSFGHWGVPVLRSLFSYMLRVSPLRMLMDVLQALYPRMRWMLPIYTTVALGSSSLHPC